MKRKITLLLFICLNACGVAAQQAMKAEIPGADANVQIDEAALALDGLSTESAFTSRLKQLGATHIVSTRSFVNEKVVSAVTADRMKAIYLFGEGKFLGKLEVHCDSGREPVRPFVKIIYGKKRFGVLLFAENLALGGKRISQLILVGKGGKKTYINLAMDDLEKSHGGMVDPFVGGDDLETGVIFCARDSKGKAWNTVFVITANEDAVKVETMPRWYALACPCFVEWVKGRDARDIFGMKL